MKQGVVAECGTRVLKTVRPPKREFSIDNLLVRIHLIIEMILVDRPCAVGVFIPFPK